MARTQVITRSTHSESLAEVLERVLDKGLVIAGDIKIKLCDVELLSIQLRLLVCSVDKAKEMGLTWWWQEAPAQSVPSPPHSVPLPAPAAAPAGDTPWQHYVQFQQAARSAAPAVGPPMAGEYPLR